jgi:hypothetical protein
MLWHVIKTISNVVKQTICLVLSQTFLIRVFVPFDTQNFSDAVDKASGGTAQYRCTLSCHLNHLAFLSRLWRSSRRFRLCASASAISAIISYTVRIAFEIPHSQIMHKIATRRDVKQMKLRLLELVVGGWVGRTLETIMLVACWSGINIGEIKMFRVGMSFIAGLVDMVSLKLQHLLASTEWRNRSDVVFDHVGSHVAIRL